MKFSTTLRAGSVRWAAPFLLLLALFYYFEGETAPLESFHDYAPTLIAEPLTLLYALAYATAAALATWESGRLRKSGVWALAPARSRFRVAANALLPALVLSWLVLLLPAALSLARTATFPTADSLRLPVMALILCVSYAVIGFAVGLRVPHVVAAPLIAVIVWVAVAFTRAVQPYWIRHVSGQYGGVGFGEVPSVISVVAPILPAGGIAVAIAVMWLPLRSRILRIVLAGLIAIAGPAGAYRITHDWPHSPPLLTGRAEASTQKTVSAAVDAVLAKPRNEQAAWVRTTRGEACRGGGA